MPEMIPIDRISTEGTQARAALSETIIQEYADAYEQGIELPPIDVYYNQETYWLADGFHRVKAAQQIGRNSITANVHPGGQRAAILHAVGANETHGLRRTNADRRQSVMLMLRDPEWSQWSNHAIARQCLVSEISVRRVRRELEPKGGERVKDETRKAERRGKVYTVRTGGIGAAKRKQPQEPTGDDGKGTEPQAITAATTQEPVSLQEQPTDVLSATMSQIDASAATVSAPERELPAESALVTATETKPNVLKVVDEAPFSAVSVISAAAAADLSLEYAWEWATQADRESFVGNHHDELQKLLKKV